MSSVRKLITILIILQVNEKCYGFFNCALTTCTCSESPDRGFDIDCPDSYNSIVKVSFDLDGEKSLEIDCRFHENYINFLPSSYLPPDIEDLNLNSLRFKTCSLPENVTVRNVMKELRIASTVSLRISYSNLKNITRQDLDGLQNLQHLEVLGNTIINTPKDLLYDLKNLITIDMKSNNIVVPQEFFHETTQLIEIEIAENYLPKNTTDLFKNLNQLKRLNMWMMKIKEIDSNIFQNLTNLETLDLSLNEISLLPTKLFNDLPNLKLLSLRRNNFQSLPTGIFDTNSNLELIILDENIFLSNLPEFLFANKTHLKNVTMKSCNLSLVPSNLFLNSENLELLDLSNNQIQILPDDLLKYQYKLKILNLENNFIKHISKDFFFDLIELNTLNLNDNFLQLAADNFKTLKKLKTLLLSNNAIESMFPVMFRDLGSLSELDLSYNKLTLLEDSTHDAYGIWSIMRDLKNLEILLLHNNNISNIFVDWRYLKNKLRILDLSNNTFTNLSYNDFEFLQQSIEVNLENNQITDIDMSKAELSRFSQELTRNSTYVVPSYRKDRKEIIVKLNNNPLHCSCNLYNLYRYFDLSMAPEVRDTLNILSNKLKCATPPEMADKRVDQIKSKSFVCVLSNNMLPIDICPSLATCYWQPFGEVLTIDLSNIGLKKIPVLTALKENNPLRFKKNVVLLQGNTLNEMPQPGMGYEKVHSLDLSNNKIDNIIWLPEQLEVLSLHNNNLTHLNNKALSLLNSTHLINLSLYNNPWECNCSTVNFLKFIQDQFGKLTNFQNITCLSTSQQIVDLTIDQLCPLPMDLIIYLCVLLTLISIATAILAGLYYRYNIEIKVWLYAHQKCLWFVTEEELDKDKIYDAFISYSHKDEDFIIAELISNLEEGPKPYKLCLHFRNWQAGEFITKNIANSIAESRRTIVILSPNFLESEWGKMEFRTAHKQALEENRARVIIILLGDIPMDDLDEEIKAYLNTNTYLKWGDPWFWDKLRYALPHSPKYVKEYQSLEKVRIDGDKLDLIHEPSTPPIQSTPPADKIIFDPMKNDILNVKLVNGALINQGFVQDKFKDKNFINR